jgi:hypothetical protein
MTIQSTLLSAACVTGLFFISATSHAVCPIEEPELAPQLHAVTQIVTAYEGTHPNDLTPLPGDSSFDVFCPFPTSIGSAHAHSAIQPTHLLAGVSVAYVALLTKKVAQAPDISQDDLMNWALTYLSCARQIQQLSEDKDAHAPVFKAIINQLICAIEQIGQERFNILAGTLSAVFELSLD